MRTELQRKFQKEVDDIDKKIKDQTDWLDKEGNKVIDDRTKRHRSLPNFLKQVIEKFPPKNQHKQEIPDNFKDISEMKKALTKLQQAYHPDKNLSFDEVWRRLTYRISQKLNEIFDTFKSCSEPTVTSEDDEEDQEDDDQTNTDWEDEESNEDEGEDDDA